MFEMAIRKRTMLARMIKLDELKDRSQTKIQHTFKRKFMDKVPVTEGDKISGLRYNLPSSVLMHIVATNPTKDIPSQVYIIPQIEKVNPAGVI